MKDEWTQVNRAGQLVKFTYDDLPHGKAFLTAQIAGHEVVCSVILPQPKLPFSRESVAVYCAVAKGDTQSFFRPENNTGGDTTCAICRHVPPKVRETLRRLSGRVEC